MGAEIPPDFSTAVALFNGMETGGVVFRRTRDWYDKTPLQDKFIQDGLSIALKGLLDMDRE